MSAAVIVQLIVALGPMALELVPKLASVWKKESLTPEEVLEICAVSEKSYSDYTGRPVPSAP